jgi:hypothetical protein
MRLFQFHDLNREFDQLTWLISLFPLISFFNIKLNEN